MGYTLGPLARAGRFCCVGARRTALAVLLVIVPALPAKAQTADSLWLSDRGGSGTDAKSYVLISGVIGGLAGYRRIERELMESGHRVIVIDPYLMSIDSNDVSFDALARRVSAQLRARGVVGATVVGHAHGGGVALRVTANSTALVSQLFLLNVGALSGNKSPVFSSSMRLASLVAHVPGGKRFMRGRIVAGIRENSGQTEWLDDRTAHDYTDGPLNNIGAVVRLAERLGNSQEPEPLSAVVGRIKVPVTLLLGALTCPASPGPEELAALKPLGELVRTIRIEGACHFPHEEAPDKVLQYFVRPRS